MSRRARHHPGPRAEGGAVVIGGDYQGPGSARTLRQHGTHVCVVDETCIARASRFVKHIIPARRRTME